MPKFEQFRGPMSTIGEQQESVANGKSHVLSASSRTLRVSERIYDHEFANSSCVDAVEGNKNLDMSCNLNENEASVEGLP